MDLYRDLVEEYREFAEYAAGTSPTFADWARGVVEDDRVRAWIASLPPIKRQPNLVFAAARWHGVAAPGPYRGLRRALLGDDGPIRTTIGARATQTNEAARLATLLPAFGLVAGRGPVVLLEAGASAGLCLFPDRWSYAWSGPEGTVALGPADAPRLQTEVTGPVPFPVARPEVAWRGGIDLNPVDVTDPDQTAWLENLIWPEHDDRRARLRAAVEIARADPAPIRRGDLLADLPELIDEARAAAPGVPVIVFHSAVIAYLEPPDRRRFATMMSDLVTAGVCHWVSNEGPRVLPDVTGELDPPTGRFVLGLDGRAVALADGHGRDLAWLSG